jgi:hypothetical protein
MEGGNGRWKPMSILHILRSEPDEMAKKLIQGLSEGEESKVIALYEGDVDYEDLVDEIFRNKDVICWW